MSSKKPSESYSLFFLLGVIGFITGILGNLLAAWFEKNGDFIFSGTGISIVITLTVVGLLAAAWLQSRPGKRTASPLALRLRNFLLKFRRKSISVPAPDGELSVAQEEILIDARRLIMDRREVIETFCGLLCHLHLTRHLRLVGEANMGKTRLIDEFYLLAKVKYNALVAKVDCKKESLTHEVIITDIIDQIGSSYFTRFNLAYDELAKTSPVQMPTDSRMLSINIEKDRQAEEHRIRKLLIAFTEDLEALKEKGPLVFFFDPFDNSPDFVKTWLNEQFLLSLFRLDHVCVVFSGRSLPEPLISCSHACITHPLQAVELADVIEWCQQQRYAIDEQVIEILHKSTRGAPGAIVPLVRNYLGGG